MQKKLKKKSKFIAQGLPKIQSTIIWLIGTLRNNKKQGVTISTHGMNLHKQITNQSLLDHDRDAQFLNFMRNQNIYGKVQPTFYTLLVIETCWS